MKSWFKVLGVAFRRRPQNLLTARVMPAVAEAQATLLKIIQESGSPKQDYLDRFEKAAEDLERARKESFRALARANNKEVR